MGLTKKGKDGSRELAAQLFPHSVGMLTCGAPPSVAALPTQDLHL